MLDKYIYVWEDFGHNVIGFFGFGLVQKSGRKCIHGATNKIYRIDETYSTMKRYMCCNHPNTLYHPRIVWSFIQVSLCLPVTSDAAVSLQIPVTVTGVLTALPMTSF